MIYDRIKYVENIDHETCTIEVRAIYTVDLSSSEAIDPCTYEETKEIVKIELAKEIQKEMIKDLSGYSFDEKDVEYITTISHGRLEKMRKLDELTKWMSIDEVEKILCAYEALRELGMFGKEKDGR